MVKTVQNWFCLCMLLVGFLMAEISFNLLDQFEYGSLENRILSGFHFLGVFFSLTGLLEAFSLAEKEVKKRRKEISGEL